MVAKTVLAYHRSNSLDHMLEADFNMTHHDDEFSIFGRAIYFAESANALTSELGQYCCKFRITLEAPILDMNKSMSDDDAIALQEKFNKMFGTDSAYDFKDFEFSNASVEGKVQFGEFFLSLEGYNKHFQQFIKSLGYNSFVHFARYGTDFIPTKGDYGRVYGIYDPALVEFVDGPF